MAKKTIRFDYFHPILGEEQKQFYNIEPILEELLKKDIAERIINYNNSSRIRLSAIERLDQYHPEGLNSPINFPVWKLVFTKLREDVPGITRIENDSVAPLDLDPDEYVADDTVMLFDPQKNIIIIQRNRQGTAPTAAKKFLATVCEKDFDDLEEMKFCPFILNTARSAARNMSYLHKISFRVFDTHSDSLHEATMENPSISQLLSSLNNFSVAGTPMTADIQLKIPGREATRSLSDKLIHTLTDKLFPLIQTEQVTKLSLSGRVDEDSPVEDVDLVHDFKREFIEFQLDRNRFIPPTTIFNTILISHLKDRIKLPNLNPEV